MSDREPACSGRTSLSTQPTTWIAPPSDTPLRPSRSGARGKATSSFPLLQLVARHLWQHPLWWVLLLCLPLVTGCGGCQRSAPPKGKNTADKDKDKGKAGDEDPEKKEKPDFERPEVHALPYEPAANNSLLNYYKPGHWTMIQARWRADNFDFGGDLEARPLTQGSRVIPLESTNNLFKTRRPVSLPKTQEKWLDTNLYIPPSSGSRSCLVELNLLTPTAAVTWSHTEPALAMPAHQYFFVVLAQDANQYTFLRQLPALNPPGRELDDFLSTARVWEDPNAEETGGTVASTSSMQRDFVVVSPPLIGRSVALPNTASCWTSISVLLWDNYDANRFSEAQQEALLDWLHWGGQLIITHPRSLDTLKGTFLEPYLPATCGATQPLVDADLSELNGWAQQIFSAPRVDAQDKKPPMALTVPSTSKLERVELVAQEGARPLPGAGELVWERTVGNGRIVVTAFHVAQFNSTFANWPGFDSFWNAFLLNRPGRTYVVKDHLPQTELREMAVAPEDPRLNTRLRFFARDIEPVLVNGRPANSVPQTPPADGAVFDEQTETYVNASNVPVESAPSVPASESELTTTPAEVTEDTAEDLVETAANGSDDGSSYDLSDPNHPSKLLRDDDPQRTRLREFGLEGYQSHPEAGLAGWNEASGCADIARSVLNEASGIDVPDRSLVAMLLAAYLVFLVPLNWVVFRILGRVEWAWLMTPILAIAGTLIVIRLAQLDIGFVRSQTELAVVELKPSYPRAHVARFAGLYTSLTTDYRVSFPGLNAIAKTFQFEQVQERQFQRPQDLILSRGRDTELQGIAVASNSTGLMHAEEFLTLPGAISAKRVTPLSLSVQNSTGLSIRDVLVIFRDAEGRLHASQFSSLANDSTVPVNLTEVTSLQQIQPQVTGITQRPGDLQILPMLNLAAHPGRLRRGQAILVGWTDQSVGQMQVEPAASQTQFRTIITAMLIAPPSPPAEPDKNLLRDVSQILESEYESIQRELPDAFRP